MFKYMPFTANKYVFVISGVFLMCSFIHFFKGPYRPWGPPVNFGMLKELSQKVVSFSCRDATCTSKADEELIDKAVL